MASNEGTERFLSAFGRRFGDGDGVNAPWLSSLRRAAIERFAELGLPTTRHEDWRYTDIAPIAALEFRQPRQDGFKMEIADLLACSLAAEARHRLVFIDGKYSAQYSATSNLPPGVRIQSLAKVLREHDSLVAPWIARFARFQEKAFVALNTAFMDDGAAVFIPEGCRLEEPLFVIFISPGTGQTVASHPRNLFVCAERSEAKIVESYVGIGKGAYFTNPVTEITAAADSVIEHYRLQREGEAAFHVGAVSVHLERQSRVTSHNVTLSGALVRNDIHVILDGEGTECVLDGLYLTDGRQHVDNHTEIEHAQPHATSQELYKGILSGHSRGVFNGKILVHKSAQKTDARQANKNLLLSQDAVINSKPQLEIYADDVKCSHGTAIGQLDRNALFYLRSRGLGAEESQSLLSYGFAAEILNRVKLTSLRARLDEFLLTKLGRRAVVQ